MLRQYWCIIISSYVPKINACTVNAYNYFDNAIDDTMYIVQD